MESRKRVAVQLPRAPPQLAAKPNDLVRPAVGDMGLFGG